VAACAHRTRGESFQTVTTDTRTPVLVRLMPTADSPIDPQVRVFRPNGDSLCGTASSGLIDLRCTLPRDGTYSIIVNDAQGDETGRFDAHLQEG
jgi:hypothetical protein